MASPPRTIDLPLENTKIKDVDKPLSGKKVLVVDDENMQQKIARIVLSKLGAIAHVSGNGEEALNTVWKALEDQSALGTQHSLPYDYIFMDCHMPVMDGIEATLQIRQEEAKYGVHMPILAVSSDTTGPYIEQMEEAGMDYNLGKPLFVEKIKDFLAVWSLKTN